MKSSLFALSIGILATTTGCLHVKTDPIEVKPIRVTVDVNVRVEKAVDDFFGTIDSKSSTVNTK